jgi:hypothetical protein
MMRDGWRCVAPAVVAFLLLARGASAAPSCPPAPVGHGPETVVVGLYLNQIASVDVKANTFLADFYLWFRWSGDIDPTQSFEMPNAIEPWSFSRDVVYKDAGGAAKADVLPDGCKFQQFHVQGRFAHPFDLTSYPLDRQQLSIRVEDTRYDDEALVYQADVKDSKVDASMQTPGFLVRSSGAEVARHSYGSPMGDTRLQSLHSSQFRFRIELGRPLVGYLSKTLVPIGFILLSTVLIFFISLSYFEGRIGLAVTTLISAVALQLTTSADLPQIGYLVLLDKLYNLSYVIILFSMFESTLAVRWHDAGREQAAQRLDHLAAVLSLVGVVLTCIFVFI